MSNKVLTQEERETVKTYNLYAKEWIKTHHTTNFWAPELKQLKNYIPQGKILEIGSGAGIDAKELIHLGYKYTGTDISLGLIKEAQKRNPKTKFIHESVYELNFLENNFDGFWAVAVLLHIPKSRIDEALQRIHFVIKANGTGLISLKKGTGEKMIEQEFQNKKFRRFYSFYSLNEFSKVLKRNKFEILSPYIRKSTKDIWLIYFVKVIK